MSRQTSLSGKTRETAGRRRNRASSTRKRKAGRVTGIGGTDFNPAATGGAMRRER